MLWFSASRAWAAELSTDGGNPLASLPILFEENQGQAPTGAQYLARIPGGVVQLGAQGLELFLQSGSVVAPLRITWNGSNPRPRIEAEPADAKVNYLFGRDPNAWIRNVPTFRRIRYFDVYPGIDLVFRGDARRFEYDWSAPFASAFTVPPASTSTTKED